MSNSYEDESEPAYEDVDIEEFKSVEENPIETEEMKLVAPRILAENYAETVHWQPEVGFSVSTGAEGALGKKILRTMKSLRSPVERFNDEVLTICKYIDLPISYQEGIIRLTSRIPDISYKNPAGFVLGTLIYKYIDKKLSPKELKEVTKILDYTKSATKKRLEISELTVIEYGRFVKNLVRGHNQSSI